jgi:hypothetical protein
MPQYHAKILSVKLQVTRWSTGYVPRPGPEKKRNISSILPTIILVGPIGAPYPGASGYNGSRSGRRQKLEVPRTVTYVWSARVGVGSLVPKEG